MLHKQTAAVDTADAPSRNAGPRVSSATSAAPTSRYTKEP